MYIQINITEVPWLTLYDTCINMFAFSTWKLILGIGRFFQILYLFSQSNIISFPRLLSKRIFINMSHISLLLWDGALYIAGMIEMLRKINLSRAVRTMQELFPEEYDFYPRSWILPEEYQQFSTQVKLHNLMTKALLYLT